MDEDGFFVRYKKICRNCFKVSTLAWMIINSNRRNLNQLENYLMYAHHCLEMRAPGTNWLTRHLVDSEQTCSRSHQMDRSLRRTLPALDFWDVVIEVSRSSNSTKTPRNPAAGNCSRSDQSKPKQKETEMLINFRMWTTLRHHKRKIFSRDESQL